jgi:hypothetical protein
MLTPFVPLSNRFISDTRKILYSRGGENLRGGCAPSRYALPFFTHGAFKRGDSPSPFFLPLSLEGEGD